MLFKGCTGVDDRSGPPSGLQTVATLKGNGGRVQDWRVPLAAMHLGLQGPLGRMCGWAKGPFFGSGRIPFWPGLGGDRKELCRAGAECAASVDCGMQEVEVAKVYH